MPLCVVPHSGSIKRKTITKLFDRFVNGRAKLWNDKEITTTLTAPGAIRTAVGGKIWSKISEKACVKILINKCGCLEHCAVQQEANAVSLAQELYCCINWCSILF